MGRKIRVIVIGDHPWYGEIGYVNESASPDKIEGDTIGGTFMALVTCESNPNDKFYCEKRHIQVIPESNYEDFGYVSKKARSKRSR